MNTTNSKAVMLLAAAIIPNCLLDRLNLFSILGKAIVGRPAVTIPKNEERKTMKESVHKKTYKKR